MEIIKIKICVAQNDGKVWISRKQHFLMLVQAISGMFSTDRDNTKTKMNMFLLFSLVVQWLPFDRFGPMAAFWLGVSAAA